MFQKTFKKYSRFRTIFIGIFNVSKRTSINPSKTYLYGGVSTYIMQFQCENPALHQHDANKRLFLFKHAFMNKPIIFGG